VEAPEFGAAVPRDQQDGHADAGQGRAGQVGAAAAGDDRADAGAGGGRGQRGGGAGPGAEQADGEAGGVRGGLQALGEPVDRADEAEGQQFEVETEGGGQAGDLVLAVGEQVEEERPHPGGVQAAGHGPVAGVAAAVREQDDAAGAVRYREVAGQFGVPQPQRDHVFGGSALMSASAERSSRWTARSPIDTMPIGCSPSTTGTRRMACSRMSRTAASASSPGATVTRLVLQTSATAVDMSFWRATARTTMSRSVTSPRRRPSWTTRTSPMPCCRMSPPTSDRDVSGDTATGTGVITSFTFMAMGGPPPSGARLPGR